MVTHGQASDPYWSVVQNGVNQAAEDMGVQVDYQAPDTFDMVAMAQLIDAAVASQPDGMAISIPDADALGESIQAGVDAGIPMVSLDSGSDVAAEMGMLTHVGQTEYEAGVGAGQRMGEAGVTTALCVNQEVGNVALDDRCRGFTDGLAESGGTVEVVEVDLNNPTEAQARIEAALSANAEVDGILTLGPTGAAPALEVPGTGQLGRSSSPPSTSRRTSWMRSNGDMLFAIDSSSMMQYSPIVLLTARDESEHHRQVLMTGPGFVTRWNAAEVIDLAAAELAVEPAADGRERIARVRKRHAGDARGRGSPGARSRRAGGKDQPLAPPAGTPEMRRPPERSASGSSSRSPPVIADSCRRGTANYLEVAAQLGILAVAVALLMIGGEFDLSIGSAIGACGIIFALLSVEFGWNVWLAMLAALVFALLLGVFNGYLVLRTDLPSFIITLGTLLIVRGVTIGITRQVTGRTVVSGLDDVPGYDAIRTIFASDVTVGGAAFSIAIVWWLGVAALATCCCGPRSATGSSASGETSRRRATSACRSAWSRSSFMGTAVAAWLVAMIQVLGARSADVVRGTGSEFTAIIAAVIGGVLLTGGYGSAIGPSSAR